MRTKINLSFNEYFVWEEIEDTISCFENIKDIYLLPMHVEHAKNRYIILDSYASYHSPSQRLAIAEDVIKTNPSIKGMLYSPITSFLIQEEYDKLCKDWEVLVDLAHKEGLEAHCIIDFISFLFTLEEKTTIAALAEQAGFDKIIMGSFIPAKFSILSEMLIDIHHIKKHISVKSALIINPISNKGLNLVLDSKFDDITINSQNILELIDQKGV